MSTIDVPLRDTQPASVPPAPQGLEQVERLLRNRTAVLAGIDAGRDLAGTARAMLLTIAAGAAMFGAAAGAYRGGEQIVYAAIKLPLALLLTAAVCAPCLTAINAALDRRADLRRDLALVLASLALGCLVLSAQAPVVLLAVTLGFGYHLTAVLLFACCAFAGMIGVALLLRGLLRERRGAISASLALLVVFGMVGSQMTWTLRPWLGRPAKPIVFLRSIEGGLLDSVRTAIDSARGVYRSSAPLLESERDVREWEYDDIRFEEPRRDAATRAEGDWL